MARCTPWANHSDTERNVGSRFRGVTTQRSCMPSMFSVSTGSHFNGLHGGGNKQYSIRIISIISQGFFFFFNSAILFLTDI